jgi:hypothetical protein
MRFNFHISVWRLCATAVVRFFCTLSSLAILLAASSAPARAQNSPSQPIGRVEGADVTVNGGMPARVATADSSGSIGVSNGSTVTVHSGKARLALNGGGVLDICGPAKFTMLTSGSEITIALSFGRLHVELPAHTALKIFSPTIIATPIAIDGGSREVTIGLDINDSLCVLASSGAIQLEQQFTGEKLIVPQAGQFFLDGGQLLPVAGKTGSCGCTPMDEHSLPLPPARLPVLAGATSTKPVVLPEAPKADVHSASPESSVELPAPETAVQPSAVFVIPVNPVDEHPLAQPEKESAGPAPEIGGTLQGEVTPALAFMASMPPAPDQMPEMMLLVSGVHESPDWDFNGHVDPPPFVAAMRHALGEESAVPEKKVGAKAAAVKQPKKRKRGFWASLKGLFAGKVEADDSPRVGVD